jgi:uracil-DNA glycosylase
MLDAVLEDIAACRACASELRHAPRPVVRVSPATRLLIAGQAPGRLVHETGLPWNDPSGNRLRDWMGLDRETFYGPRIGVAAMAFCFPGTNPKGGDFPPPSRCADLWRRRLLDALPKMELTLLVGGYAQAWTLGRRAKQTMTETVRAWREYADEGLIPLPHPSWRNTAWIKRHPWFEAEVVPHLRHEVARVLAR